MEIILRSLLFQFSSMKTKKINNLPWGYVVEDLKNLILKGATF